jgi:D-glycero-D-manno-heptose 1,7-bisphosphate phosphatase
VRPGWAEAPERGPLSYTSDRRVDRCGHRPAVFLDRDGVLNELACDPVTRAPESPLGLADVRLIAGAAAAARELARAGFALVCVSNQPAAAKGWVSVDQLQSVHERVLSLLARERLQLDTSRLCPHHPEGVVAALAGPCGCRKPRPGMLFDAAAELGLDLSGSWMVGDTDADVAAGHNAGCRTILLDTPGSAHKRSGAARPDRFATNLAAAAPLLLSESSGVRG